MHRREFLKKTALSVGSASVAPAGPAAPKVSLLTDPSDPVASEAPVQWAAGELEQALAGHGIALSRTAENGAFRILASGPGIPTAAAALKRAGLAPPAAPESLAMAPGIACGADSRGLMYALLELADRVRYASDPMAALSAHKPVSERSANPVRSIMRLFVSDVEDKPWFNDREMWPQYFSMLAAQRFNRFAIAFGIGYDFLRQVTDAYFLFAYPFLISVPGYNVRASGLPDAERDRNLEMLQFISSQAAAHGLEFQLSIWTHGYRWTDSPRPNFTIEGLSAENHAAYCRDALAALLKSCPAITGVTFRIHGESGVPEGSYGFWKTVFDGVVRSGRTVEIDMHSKGIDPQMIDTALGTGMPVNVSPKFWAEHMGMPYHQAAIRELEMPRAGRNDQGFFALSSGSRSFTRYGYADLLREDRRYGVVHRIWSGTQRLLLWGDPLTAAAYSRAFGFCGSKGVEIMEPLSFKGRRGSGIAGGRCAYAEAALKPRWDWEKYQYPYRVWGRLLYNPEADPDCWRRYLWKRFQSAAPAAEAALAHASRILPIVTTAHGASAANNNYWPEIYTNQPIVDARRPSPYSDSPTPRTFGNVSPFDPQLFSRINDFADELARGERSGKYSPVDVARWLDERAAAASGTIPEPKGDSDLRRLAIDAALQAGLGRFFAAKLRAGVLYAIFERTGDRGALEAALKHYRDARASWAKLANLAKGVYMADITVGEQPWLRGHWLDRLPAIDADIADMEKRLESAKGSDERVRAWILETEGKPTQARMPEPLVHKPPAKFVPGSGLEIGLVFEGPEKLASVRLCYRHVNQAERYEEVEMRQDGNQCLALIPGNYTRSPYPLQYYFVLKAGPEKVWLHPGFSADLANQPYFVVRSS
jgi:hypothetical protein